MTGEHVSTTVTLPGWVRATHPDTGEQVTFVPGEALPAWVVAQLPTGRTDPTDVRVTVLHPGEQHDTAEAADPRTGFA